MNRAFLIHLGFMVLGYALAVLVASIVTVFIMSAPTVLPDNGAWGSAYKTLYELASLMMLGAYFTMFYALPGWLISIATAERCNEKRRFWFAIAGLITASLAHLIAYYHAASFSEPLIISGSLVGGFCGGLVYWAIAGKRSGAWKSVSKSEDA